MVSVRVTHTKVNTFEDIALNIGYYLVKSS